MTHSLNWILQRTGSQCNCRRLGVMCSPRAYSVGRLAEPRHSAHAVVAPTMKVANRLVMSCSSPVVWWRRPGPGVASVLVRHDDESVANDGDGKNRSSLPYVCAASWTARSRVGILWYPLISPMMPVPPERLKWQSHHVNEIQLRINAIKQHFLTKQTSLTWTKQTYVQLGHNLTLTQF